MSLPKELTRVTATSKVLAATLFIFLPILTFFYGMQYQREHLTPNIYLQYNNPVTTVKNNKKSQKDLCNFNIKLPIGYSYQEPINSFYGNTSTSTQIGQICKVILGPNYKAGYEGFSGENIQINAYSTDMIDIKELVHDSIESNAYLPLHAYRFTRPSYGGEDEVLVFENNYTLYEIFWRNDPKDLEPIIKQIAAQL